MAIEQRTAFYHSFNHLQRNTQVKENLGFIHLPPIATVPKWKTMSTSHIT